MSLESFGPPHVEFSSSHDHPTSAVASFATSTHTAHCSLPSQRPYRKRRHSKHFCTSEPPTTTTMAPKKPSTFQKAHLRGLLDQPRADGAVDKSGQPILERKPLHERRRILARVRREEPSKKREEEFDVPAKEMMEASEIVQADQDWVEQRRRGRKMERMGRDQGVGR